jgi:ubiquinone/menaquinone biosynthesis C-methylase UbiE
MVDACFAIPRLAAIYDALDGPREDLDLYTAIASQLGATTIADIGCGTGTFACAMAARGFEVTGIDPAAASVAIARAKPFADQVHWIVGDINKLDGLDVDLLTMTGNVAQVFTSDAAWAVALRCCRAAIRKGGTLVLETRTPSRQAWRSWTREQTAKTVAVPELGRVDAWCDVTEVALPLISFRWTYKFAEADATMYSDSTLRFREQEEIAATLSAARFTVTDIRDAPDRPGAEMVFLAEAR